VIFLTGEFPLELFLVFMGNHFPVEGYRRPKFTFTSVTPLSRAGFNTLLNTMRGRSSFTFRTPPEPAVIMQQISNEGTANPVVARLHLGILTLRDAAPPNAIDVEAFDRALDIVISNLRNARAGANLVDELFSSYQANIQAGTIITRGGGGIQISQSIEQPLNEAVENFINNTGRALKTGMQRAVKAAGGNIGLLFTKDRPFEEARQQLEQTDPLLAEYLRQARSDWTQGLIALRNTLEHEDRILPTIVPRLNGQTIEIDEPTIGTRTVRGFAHFHVDRLCRFIEDVLVHVIQQRLRDGFIFEEIPIANRTEGCATRFRLGAGHHTAGWRLTYTPTKFVDC
jgi:hypothetical protein